MQMSAQMRWNSLSLRVIGSHRLVMSIWPSTRPYHVFKLRDWFEISTPVNFEHPSSKLAVLLPSNDSDQSGRQP